MTKVKTADLIGPALDWAVAKAQGHKEIRVFGRTRPSDRGWIEVRFNPDPRATTARFDPSENWSQGGPIMDREGIYFNPLPDKGIRAYRFIDGEYCNIMDCWGAGITRCAVAMRCFVASKLGDEVDIPEELL